MTYDAHAPDIVIGTIPNPTRDDYIIKVSLGNFKGKDLVNVRHWKIFDDGVIPTKRGIALPADADTLREVAAQIMLAAEHVEAYGLKAA